MAAAQKLLAKIKERAATAIQTGSNRYGCLAEARRIANGRILKVGSDS